MTKSTLPARSKNDQLTMYDDLARSGLDADDAKRLRFAELTAAETKALTGIAARSYKLPYFTAADETTSFWRVRFLADVRGRDGKARRYTQPADSTPMAYFTPGIPWGKVFKDTGTTIVITEGEKKAAKACKHGIVTIGLGGIWNFRASKVGIALLDDLDQIGWTGRLVEIAHDGEPNEDTRAATAFLARELIERGARVMVVQLPIDQKLDDFLVNHTVAEYHALPRTPVDAKAQVKIVRTFNNTEREKKELITKIVMADVTAAGSFHVADEEPLFFDTVDHRLLTLLDPREANLRAHFLERYGINGSEPEWAFLYEALRARALHHGAATTTHMFSYYDAEKTTLYAYCGANSVFKVTPDGYKTVANGTDDVLFRGFKVAPLTPATRPSKAAFQYLLDLPNFEGGSRLTPAQQAMMYEIFIWSLFFTSYIKTRPILLLYAVKGSGKTSAGRAIGKTLFGDGFDVHQGNINQDALKDEVVPALIQSPFVVLDNLDGYRRDGIENLLAVASTGGTIPKRVLYTTMTKVDYPIRARVIVTSRQPDALNRDDVRDRTIVLSLERRKSFLPEERINKTTLDNRAGWWAYALDRLPVMIAAIATHKPTPTPHRLADFAQFAVAIAPAIGYDPDDVAAALDALEGERNAFASERSNILRALEHWADAKRATHETSQYDAAKKTPFRLRVKLATGELFEEVFQAWPKSAGSFPFKKSESFGIALKNDETMLREYFTITREKGRGNKTLVTIEEAVTPNPTGRRDSAASPHRRQESKF